MLLEVHGLRRTVLYRLPLQHSADLIINYYVNELVNGGFEIIYKGRNAELGLPGQWYRKVFISSKNIVVWKDLSRMLTGRVFCYISARKESGKDDMIYLSIFAVNHRRNNKSTVVFVFVSL